VPNFSSSEEAEKEIETIVIDGATESSLTVAKFLAQRQIDKGFKSATGDTKGDF
jgi:hypothetical protein